MALTTFSHSVTAIQTISDPNNFPLNSRSSSSSVESVQLGPKIGASFAQQRLMCIKTGDFYYYKHNAA